VYLTNLREAVPKMLTESMHGQKDGYTDRAAAILRVFPKKGE
jgi:hypothetical protein